MGKLARKAYLTYIDSSFGGVTPSWFLIGKDIEDMSVELNPETETKENILGESTTNDKGYSPTLDADPYYANPDDSIYAKLKDIAMNRKKGGDCETKVLEVIIEDDEDTSHSAWTENVIVKPQSYGGGIEGFNIPFNVAFNGSRTAGTVAISNGVPTFTATT